jgi:hypothetical protein
MMAHFGLEDAMPLIVGYNISPLIPVDIRYVRTDKPTDEDQAYFKRVKKEGPVVPGPFSWRNELTEILEKTTAEFWDIPVEDVSCFFPHDPSVPTNPYPIATLIVELLFDKPARTLEKRRAYAKALAEACQDFLDRLRGTTDARVEVAVKRFDPEKDGCYVTPTKT